MVIFAPEVLQIALYLTSLWLSVCRLSLMHIYQEDATLKLNYLTCCVKEIDNYPHSLSSMYCSHNLFTLFSTSYLPVSMIRLVAEVFMFRRLIVENRGELY